MEKEQEKTQKITAGKKNSKIILNPPEKPPIKNVNERFKDALPKHAVVIEKKIELVLQAKANTTEFPEEALRQVFVRGYKTLPLNSQLTREQHAMNRVNSFIAGGAAMQEDYDLIPIDEKFKRLGMKGTGGARRPHIKREKSPYNNKTVFHVVDANGVVKHSTSDEGEAKQHLAQKYNSYMNEAKQMKGEDPCWKGYHMVGKKIKAGREVPNCVPKNEEVQPVNEISKELANRYYWSAKSSGDEMDKKISSKVKKLGDKWSQRTHNNLTDLLAKSQKRTAGRLRALDRLNKEEVEPIVELSSDKLNKYIQRATGEHGHYNMARRNTTGDQQKEFARKETKRSKGISKAFDKLDAKNEEVESITELSKQTLSSYMQSAKKGQLRTTRSILAGSQSKNVAREYDNRTSGIIKARARLKKEEVEDISEMDKSQTPPGRDGGTKSSGPDRTAKPLKAKQMMDKAHKVMMKSMSNADKVKNGWRNPNMAEATSVAIRMQRALEKIKAERERKERLAAPYVNSVFGKKDEKKPEPKKD